MLRKTLPAAFGLLLLAQGCSQLSSLPNPLDLVSGPSVVHVDVTPSDSALPLLRNGQTLSLAVAEFTDARPGARGRKLGDIKATVTNMSGTILSLDQDANSVLSAAARGQLAADGLRVVGAGEAAEFRLGGVVKEFSLNILGRDERVIAVEATLREGKSGDVIWSGLIREQDDRFAGVSGNSRATITEYLNQGVSTFAGKLSAAVRDSLSKSYPRSIAVSQTKNVSTIPGVTTMVAPAARDEPIASAVAVAATPAPAPATAPAAQPAAVAIPAAARAASPTAVTAPANTAAVGYVAVTSIPARVKVYVDDVYYGVTPIKIELPIGVGQLRFKLDDYKPASEKVAVRRGEVTELEIKLKK
jgi:hypothetical protein